MSPLLANALPPGGTIAIVSPASPYDTYSDVLRGIAWWKAHGYRVKLAERALLRTYCTARSPALPALAPSRGGGRVVGGRLSDLQHTVGTPWEFTLDDAIFVFEEVGSSPHGIDRALLQLSQAGKFERAGGVVVGDLEGCEWKSEEGGAPWPHTKTLEEMLEERLASLGVPVIYKLPFGHGTHNATLPLGVQATLYPHTCTLLVTEPSLLRGGGG